MNWKEETVERLSRYSAMANAVKVIPTEVRRLEQEAAALSGATPTFGSSRSDRRGREDQLLSILVRKQELENNHTNAQLWIQFTDRALEQLMPEERDLLVRMYIARDRNINALCSELGLEKTSLYRRRDIALKRLTLAMYGALES